MGIEGVSLLLAQQGLSESLTEDAEVEEAVELLRLRLPWVRARCFRPFSEDPRSCTSQFLAKESAPIKANADADTPEARTPLPRPSMNGA